ncbi:hypothetical protein HP532_24920 [Pseudomonas sp. CrR25]|nr:hypothetical protein [Pseudomonas sp. CrR25]
MQDGIHGISPDAEFTHLFCTQNALFANDVTTQQFLFAPTMAVVILTLTTFADALAKADTPIANSLSYTSPRCARLVLQVGSHGLQGYGAALPR